MRRPSKRTTPTATKRTSRARSAKSENVVVYRGIKLAPISGKRSPTAQALREALCDSFKKSRDESS
jgi:hypothetical protein